MKKILIAMLMLAPLSLFAQHKFAHFNSADIIPNMKEYTQANDELQVIAKQYEDDVKLMQSEFQKKLEEYQKESANLLENVRQRREQELQDLQQRLQMTYQDNQEAFQKAQAEKMQAIQEKVMGAVKKVGEDGGYLYIMDTSNGVVPFINTTLSTDVSADIKKALGM